MQAGFARGFFHANQRLIRGRERAMGFGEKKKEVKETLTSLKAGTPIG
jgi:hypothetical protein